MPLRNAVRDKTSHAGSYARVWQRETERRGWACYDDTWAAWTTG